MPEETNYERALAALAENDTPTAQVYASLYLGEQIEVATGMLTEIAPHFNPALRENMPTRRKK